MEPKKDNDNKITATGPPLTRKSGPPNIYPLYPPTEYGLPAAAYSAPKPNTENINSNLNPSATVKGSEGSQHTRPKRPEPKFQAGRREEDDGSQKKAIEKKSAKPPPRWPIGKPRKRAHVEVCNASVQTARRVKFPAQMEQVMKLQCQETQTDQTITVEMKVGTDDTPDRAENVTASMYEQQEDGTEEQQPGPDPQHRHDMMESMENPDEECELELETEQ